MFHFIRKRYKPTQSSELEIRSWNCSVNYFWEGTHTVEKMYCKKKIIIQKGSTKTDKRQGFTLKYIWYSSIFSFSILLTCTYIEPIHSTRSLKTLLFCWLKLMFHYVFLEFFGGREWKKTLLLIKLSRSYCSLPFISPRKVWSFKLFLSF